MKCNKKRSREVNRHMKQTKFFAFVKKSLLFVKFSSVSIITTVIDNIVFIIAHSWLNQVLFSMIIARLIAGNFQFIIGKKLVFHSEKNIILEAVKYWLLVAVLMIFSYLLLNLFEQLIQIDIVIAKILAEAIVFFLSFLFQKYFVFSFIKKVEE